MKPGRVTRLLDVLPDTDEALHIGGLGLLTWAAFTIATAAGIAAAGVACLITGWLIEKGRTP